MSENDLIDRRALYAIGMLSKEQMDEIQKSEEDAAAAEDDDDEWLLANPINYTNTLSFILIISTMPQLKYFLWAELC